MIVTLLRDWRIRSLACSWPAEYAARAAALALDFVVQPDGRVARIKRQSRTVCILPGSAGILAGK